MSNLGEQFPNIDKAMPKRGVRSALAAFGNNAFDAATEDPMLIFGGDTKRFVDRRAKTHTDGPVAGYTNFALDKKMRYNERAYAGDQVRKAAKD